MTAAAGGAALPGEEGGAGQQLGAPGGEAAAAAWLEGDGGDGLLGEEGAQDEFMGSSEGQRRRMLAATGLQQPISYGPSAFNFDPSLSDMKDRPLHKYGLFKSQLTKSCSAHQQCETITIVQDVCPICGSPDCFQR